MLVIDERPAELLPRHFFLVTNAGPGEASGAALVQRYRRQGATEKDFGEWQHALDVSLSSTNRPRVGDPDHPPATRSEPVDSFAVNESTLLMSLLAANLLHTARVLERRARAALMSRETSVPASSRPPPG